MSSDPIDLTERYAQLKMPIDEWLSERVANCERLAETRPAGPDRDGWLEDARYFEAALALIMGLKNTVKFKVYSVRGSGIYGGGMAIIGAESEDQVRKLARTIHDPTWNTDYERGEIGEEPGLMCDRSGVFTHFETGE